MVILDRKFSKVLINFQIFEIQLISYKSFHFSKVLF